MSAIHAKPAGTRKLQRIRQRGAAHHGLAPLGSGGDSIDMRWGALRVGGGGSAPDAGAADSAYAFGPIEWLSSALVPSFTLPL
jgi:hypothetical protein